MNIKLITDRLKKAGSILAMQNAQEKNVALLQVAEALNQQKVSILKANLQDVSTARKQGISESLIDRLTLTEQRIDSIVESLKNVISQTDPIGEEIAGWRTPNGLNIRQIRVPLGVVAIIYESRPNVTVDAFSLAYKSGNAILLRGSSSA